MTKGVSTAWLIVSLALGLFCGGIYIFSFVLQPELVLPTPIQLGLTSNNSQAVLNNFDFSEKETVQLTPLKISQPLTVVKQTSTSDTVIRLLTQTPPTPTLLDPTPTLLPSPTFTPTPTPTPIGSGPTVENSPTPTPTVVTPTSTAPAPNSLNPEILFSLINAHRQSMGLPTFEKESRICAIAEQRAPQIHDEVFVTHNIHAGFYALNLPYWATENAIALDTEQESYNWWMNSEIHRKAIESTNKYACGACSGHACVMIFTSFIPK